MLIAIVLLCPRLFADEPAPDIPPETPPEPPPVTFSFDFATECGGLFSTAREFVLKDNNDVISRLDWPIIAPYISVMSKLNIHKFVIQVSATSAIPPVSACGQMEDFDFLLPNSDSVSHYSMHDIYLDKYYDVGIKAGGKFSFKRINLDVIPMAGFSFSSRKWSAMNGYVQYPASNQAWTGNEEKRTVSGTVISYEQAVYAPFVAIETRLALSNFLFGLSAHFSPYFWAYSLDTHFVTNTQYYDTMNGGLAYGLSLSARWYFLGLKPDGGGNKSLYLGLGLSCSYSGVRSSTGSTAYGVIGVVDSSLQTSSSQSKLESDEFKVSFVFVLSGIR
jgi:outer membrane protease